eukprot:gnl/Chilomastix_cuspidata/3788.p1 GENE.gnl/Chilomastix_cuspidata/3788~~gnl/Chilomastix_cuspidata/3788.p1  ORF type:complete len:858 (-),score=299.81 gnl/Chilomastix_cuspidata/3788:8-2581(-)
MASPVKPRVGALCDSCSCNLEFPESKVHFQCYECKGDVRICLDCYLSGSCFPPHKTEHKLFLRGSLSQRSWDPTWTIDNELQLLSELESFQRFDKVSETMGKTEEEVTRHFRNCYIKGPLSSESLARGELPPLPGGTLSLERPQVRPATPQHSVDAPAHDHSAKDKFIHGFLPFRAEFYVEPMHWAEYPLSVMRWDAPNETDASRRAKLAVVQQYNLLLQERNRRKNFIFKHGYFYAPADAAQDMDLQLLQNRSDSASDAEPQPSPLPQKRPPPSVRVGGQCGYKGHRLAAWAGAVCRPSLNEREALAASSEIPYEPSTFFPPYTEFHDQSYLSALRWFRRHFARRHMLTQRDFNRARVFYGPLQPCFSNLASFYVFLEANVQEYYHRSALEAIAAECRRLGKPAGALTVGDISAPAQRLRGEPTSPPSSPSVLPVRSVIRPVLHARARQHFYEKEFQTYYLPELSPAVVIALSYMRPASRLTRCARHTLLRSENARRWDLHTCNTKNPFPFNPYGKLLNALLHPARGGDADAFERMASVFGSQLKTPSLGNRKALFGDCLFEARPPDDLIFDRDALRGTRIDPKSEFAGLTHADVVLAFMSGLALKSYMQARKLVFRYRGEVTPEILVLCNGFPGIAEAIYLLLCELSRQQLTFLSDNPMPPIRIPIGDFLATDFALLEQRAPALGAPDGAESAARPQAAEGDEAPEGGAVGANAEADEEDPESTLFSDMSETEKPAAAQADRTVVPGFVGDATTLPPARPIPGHDAPIPSDAAMVDISIDGAEILPPTLFRRAAARQPRQNIPLHQLRYIFGNEHFPVDKGLDRLFIDLSFLCTNAVARRRGVRLGAKRRPHATQ